MLHFYYWPEIKFQTFHNKWETKGNTWKVNEKSGWYKNMLPRPSTAVNRPGSHAVSTVRVSANTWRMGPVGQAQRAQKFRGGPPSPPVSRPGSFRVRCSAPTLEYFWHLHEGSPLLSSLCTRPWWVSTFLTHFHLSSLSTGGCHSISSAYYPTEVFLSSFLNQAFLQVHLFSLLSLWCPSTARPCTVVLGSTQRAQGQGCQRGWRVPPRGAQRCLLSQRGQAEAAHHLQT